jgi:hypothetical protein
MGGIARWLVNDAPHDTVEALFAAFCQEIARSVTPVWRASLGLEVLHPEVSGGQHVRTNESPRRSPPDLARAIQEPSSIPPIPNPTNPARRALPGIEGCHPYLHPVEVRRRAEPTRVGSRLKSGSPVNFPEVPDAHLLQGSANEAKG